MNGNRTPAGELRLDLPEGFQQIIDRATSRDPAARFPSVRAMGKALLAFASPKAALTWANTFSDAEASDVIPGLPVQRRSVARWLAVALALLALVAAEAIGGWKLCAPAARTIETPPSVTSQTMTQTTRRLVIPTETPPATARRCQAPPHKRARP